MKDEMSVVALFFILSPSSFRLAFLRDGVTGNTSGFELEDEGSTPSPAANKECADLSALSIQMNKSGDEPPHSKRK